MISIKNNSGIKFNYMKINLLIIAILFLFTSTLSAQSQNAGTFSFQVGYDLGVHGTKYTSKFGGFVVDTDTSAALTKMAGLSAQYNIVNWLSFGATYTFGGYVEDTADANANGNRTGYITFDLRAYPINGERFNLYVGPEFGYSYLEINRLLPGNIDEIYNYNGGHFGVNLGFNWYFVDFAGIFMQLQYTKNNFTLQDYSLDGTAIDLTNFDVTLDTFSAGAKFGLCFKIN